MECMQEATDLTREECERLLRAGIGGRIAISSPTGPHIVPVNYSVVDDAVIVRTSPYSVLGTYGPDSVLAFEVDQFDHERQRGWSVVVRGRAEAVMRPAELEHIRRTWEPQPWAAGSRGLHLRLRWTEISGRRIGTHWDPARSLPVRRTV
jgi:nitroimidazol reductase NimA-like FMN-containing flavoprotein (pyridoxamine 5'-phosphate oxidase superfamily)